MIIFSGVPGRVVRVDDPAVPATVSGPVSMEGWGGFNSFRAAIGNVSTAYGCNYQFMHTLGGSIYVYSFGDKVGSISVAGIAFNADCGNSSLGIDKVRQYYQANKLSKRATPLKLSIGSSTMLGMLIGMNDSSAQAEMPMFQFQLEFALIPDPSKDDGSESGGGNNGGGIAENTSNAPSESSLVRDEGPQQSFGFDSEGSEQAIIAAGGFPGIIGPL